MFSRSLASVAVQLLVCALLFGPRIAMAQHHGGHGMGAGGIPGASNRPTGVQAQDDLKDFHHALAVQATSQQIADFQALVKETDAAKAKLETFLQELQKSRAGSRPSVSVAEIDQTLQRILIDSRKFVDGFSATQKSGLKETLKRLTKADSDLDAEEKRLDETVHAETRSTADIESMGQSVRKSLSAFSDQQLALGREMGVLLAQGSDVSFNLPEVKNPVKVGDHTFDVTARGELLQTAAQGAERSFKLQIFVDVSELRQNLTDLLRPQLSAGHTCGERLELRQAMMTPAAPATIVNLSLHYERWSCMGGVSQELAEGDGSVDIKLHPVVEKSNSLELASEFSRIDAPGLMGQSLRSGELGDELRDKLSQSMLSILRSSVDFQKLLPAVVRQLAEVQSARFEDGGVGKMSVVLDGQMQITDEQANLMASQLNQALFAQGAASKDAEPAKGP